MAEGLFWHYKAIHGCDFHFDKFLKCIAYFTNVCYDNFR